MPIFATVFVLVSLLGDKNNGIVFSSDVYFHSRETCESVRDLLKAATDEVYFRNNPIFCVSTNKIIGVK